MPPHGADAYFQYPSGVRVTLLNVSVLVLRPIGWKLGPGKGVQGALGMAITMDTLGVPPDGEFGIYLGSGKVRPGDVVAQLTGTHHLLVFLTEL